MSFVAKIKNYIILLLQFSLQIKDEFDSHLACIQIKMELLVLSSIDCWYDAAIKLVL